MIAKSYLLLFLLLVFALQATAQKGAMRQAEGLKGPVRSVRTEEKTLTKQAGKWKTKRLRIASTTYDPAGKWAETATYNPDGSLNDKNTYSYDDKNDLIEMVDYYDGGTKSSRHTYTYSYNNERKLAEKASYYANQLLYKEVYSYEERKRITKVIHPNGEVSNTKTYTYDDGGNLIEIHEYNVNGPVESRTTFTTNSKERWRERAGYDGKGNLQYRSVEHYDEAGRVSENDSYKADGTLDFKMVYSYPDKNRIEAVCYKADGSIVFREIDNYEYDSYGNWIKKTSETFYRDGRPSDKQVISRTITYY